ncbi:MAG TPA: protein kinase, partial [Ignavibacteriaceae bacterium]|nr:protein kinase [Ignavibacteriaceae bacterium]
IQLSSIWYRQSQVELGNRIKMFSPSNGFAISKGRGDISGEAYSFENSRWSSFYSFSYSDFPIIEKYDSTSIWIVNHLIHPGDYKPVLTEFKKNRKKEIPLPKIMWDEIDYSMWRTLFILPDGTAWMAGQQGNIIYYDGKKWIIAESPIKKDSLPNLLSGDISDIYMTSEKNGWGVGKDGLIIHFNGSNWEKSESPVNVNLEKIWMYNENLGWAVGQRGTILRFNGTKWIKEKTETAQNLLSVKGLDSNYVIAVGSNSTLLFFNGKEWLKDISAKSIDDSFFDIDIIRDSLSAPLIWLIGGTGIYTNSKSIGFSFTDFTSHSSLRRNGKGGIFFDKGDDGFPDLMVLNEEGQSLFYENNKKGIFTEKIFPSPLHDIYGSTVGDVNNDGRLDVLQLLGGDEARLYLGTKNGFINFTEKSNLDLSEVETYAVISSHFADFDNDGDLDLFISNYEKGSLFYKNNGSAQFEKIIPEFRNYYGHRTLGATLSDFNNDGLVDIFIPFQTPFKKERYKLYLNKGNFKFNPKSDETFHTDKETSILTSVSLAQDFNNDGFTDIFIYNQKASSFLLLNNGDASFKDVSLYSGFVQTVTHPEPVNGIINSADVNNDGLLDIYVSSKLFLNNDRIKFTEVSEQTGINFTGNPSFSDFDQDGDVDLFVGSSRISQGKGDRAILYRNNLNNKNFIKVKAAGDLSNRAAIGAKVFLISSDSAGKETGKQLREIGLGSSPMIQQNISEVHFGAPQGFKYSAKIIFPSGIEKFVEDIKPGSSITIYESSFFSRFRILSQKSLQRTYTLIDPFKESLKFLLFIVVLIFMILTGRKIGAKNFVSRFYFPAILIIVYLFLVHLTIMESEVVANSVPILLSGTIGWISVFASKEFIERKNAKYISHYKLGEVLGQGGMGKVFLAEDTNTKKIAALKVINPEIMKDPANKKRFLSEGKILSSFNHPNIIKIYETGETENNAFIAMEYLSNGTLKDYIQKNFPISIKEIKKISLQICEGINEIHKKGIVHRDLKTNNIMFDEEFNIRIMDFGLSKSNLVSTMTNLGTVLGTLGYVAPEQVTNSGVDKRSDIFSFGVILYEMCTNELPFKGNNEIALIHAIFNTVPVQPSSLNKNIPLIVDEIIERCLQKDPAKRYSSVEELKVDLEKI